MQKSSSWLVSLGNMGPKVVYSILTAHQNHQESKCARVRERERVKEGFGGEKRKREKREKRKNLSTAKSGQTLTFKRLLK